MKIIPVLIVLAFIAGFIFAAIKTVVDGREEAQNILANRKAISTLHYSTE